MNPFLAKTIHWAPRILGLLIALFTAIFSFDVFGEGASFWQTMLAFFMHLLFPTLLLLAGVALAWRWPLVGTVIFLGWAVFYLASMGGFDIFTYLLISGIPALVGLLFLIDWLNGRRILLAH